MHFLRGLHGLRFRLFNHRIHHIRLPPQVDLLFEKAVHPLHAIRSDVFGDNRLASRR